jgi:TonB-dependent receptor
VAAIKTITSPRVRAGSSMVAWAVRRALRPRASALAIGAIGALGSIASGMALAADAAASSAADSSLSEIVVTGLRVSLETSQEKKRDSEQIVDSVTAQDIGALPDRSIAEALQRIPGVMIERTSAAHDPARLTAEGGNVFVRGLPWVRSETNGRDIFSATSGRTLSFEDVSADLLAGIDVFKNPSADMIEGGIAGTVNLRTRQPFDTNKRLLAASVDYNYADFIKKHFWTGNGLFSDQWETGIGRIGALFAVSIANAGNRTDSIQAGAYQKETASNGDTVYLPNAAAARTVEWEQKRETYNGSLQWAPSDQLTLTAQAVMTEAKPTNIEHDIGDNNDLGEMLTPNAGNVYYANGVVVKGIVQPSYLTTDTRYELDHNTTRDFSFNAKYRPNERWAFSWDLQYVKSHHDLLSMTAYTQLANPAGYNGTMNYNFAGNTPSMMFSESPNTTATESAYWWSAAMDHLEDNDAYSWAERFDTDYTFDDNPWLKSLRLGVRATDKDSITRETGYNWGFLSNAFWNGGAGNPNAAYVNNSPASASSLYTFPNFMGGKVGVPAVGWFPSVNLVSNGTAYAYSILKSTETSGWGWAPLSGNYYSNAQPAGDNQNGGINDQHEDTFAAYAVLRFAHDSPIGPMDGNVGARIVHTQENTNAGLIRIGGFSNYSLSGCQTAALTNPQVNCTAYTNAYLFAQGANQVLPAAAQNYNDVLPTLNLRFLLKDDLQLRFAAGRAISRPDFSQMQNNVALSNSFTGYAPGVGSNLGSVATEGNPYLKPTTANQFDTSLEWYFAPAGSLTADVFYKDIHNYVFSGNTTVTYTSNGQTLTFNTQQAQNGAHGSVKGVEVAYQQFYDFLPWIFSGLGLQANYTYVDAQGGKNTALNPYDAPEVTGATATNLPLEGISKNSYNLAVLYEKYRVSARLAYNWRDRYLLTSSAANINLPVWSENYGQLDASVFYSITEHIKVGVQAINLIDSRTFLDVGYPPITPRYSWSDTDRRISAVVRGSF